MTSLFSAPVPPKTAGLPLDSRFFFFCIAALTSLEAPRARNGLLFSPAAPEHTPRKRSFSFPGPLFDNWYYTSTLNLVAGAVVSAVVRTYLRGRLGIFFLLSRVVGTLRSMQAMSGPSFFFGVAEAGRKRLSPPPPPLPRRIPSPCSRRFKSMHAIALSFAALWSITFSDRKHRPSKPSPFFCPWRRRAQPIMPLPFFPYAAARGVVEFFLIRDQHPFPQKIVEEARPPFPSLCLACSRQMKASAPP